MIFKKNFFQNICEYNLGEYIKINKQISINEIKLI